ncbi:MAG: glycoside hydrolase family 97 protein [Bacteroidetes bacterium]|uniref:Glycoside hydrolase family 97 protein n=1 Tax=Candidatus Cryptobacteroides intestinavium TaxID=2840766 RepID=A0A9D9EQH3_9BACT|nr:glycoside hydrolase family 97 protein [Candidatus Cryptobacteroides intestinavium]
MKKTLVLMTAIAVATAATAAPKDYTLSSPDGGLEVKITADDGISWSLYRDGACLLTPSRVSMTLEDGTVYGTGKFRTAKGSEDDNNSLTFKFKECDLVFKAFDDGVAYRFISRSKTPFKVVSEQAEFALPDDWSMYVPYVRDYTDNFETQYFNSFENTYSHIRVSEWDSARLAFLPLLVEAPEGVKLCIMETDLMNYPGMYLYNGDGDTSLEGSYARYPKEMEQGGHNMLQMVVRSREDYIAKYDGATSFPWRIVAVSAEDKDLLANRLAYRLATPAAEGSDYSWVRPGKVAWEWWNDWNLTGVDFKTGINNDTYKYYIDFASKHGIEYVILDEGWAVNLKADLMQVVPEIDLEELVEYGRERNVGIILWAGYWAFDRDMENVCRYFSEMGVKGFKIDFMDRDDQMMVDFHRRAAETAAKYHLLVDFHGTYKPAGLDRTYPNVVNYEGVHGLEQMKWSGENVDQVTYDVTIPFIRMVPGPMDYTQGAMRNASRGNYRPVNSEAMSQGTRCRQLAEYIVFNSPLTMLCDSPSNYMKEPECLEFISEVPTVWDEIVPLDGKVAEYVAVAKRKGDVWYVGGMTNWDARDMEVDLLQVLGDGEWTVEIFTDGVNADRAGCDYRKSEYVLKAADNNTFRLGVHLAPGGGFAAKFTPVR